MFYYPHIKRTTVAWLGRHGPRDGKTSILNERNLIFLAQKNFKLLSQIKENPINHFLSFFLLSPASLYLTSAGVEHEISTRGPPACIMRLAAKFANYVYTVKMTIQWVPHLFPRVKAARAWR